MVQDVRRWLLDDFLSKKITRKIPNLKTKKEETIMRKSKMTILGCMGVFLIAVLVLIPAAQAGEKTIKYKVFHYITKSEVVPVPDVEKHFVGCMKGEAWLCMKMAKPLPFTPGVRLTLSRGKVK